MKFEEKTSQRSKQLFILKNLLNLFYMISLGDEIVLGNCRRAVSTNTGETLWDSNDAPDTTLLASCTILGGNGTDYFRAQDCINGSLLQSQILGRQPTNLTTLQDVFHKLGKFLFCVFSAKSVNPKDNHREP